MARCALDNDETKTVMIMTMNLRLRQTAWHGSVKKALDFPRLPASIRAIQVQQQVCIQLITSTKLFMFVSALINADSSPHLLSSPSKDNKYSSPRTTSSPP